MTDFSDANIDEATDKTSHVSLAEEHQLNLVDVMRNADRRQTNAICNPTDGAAMGSDARNRQALPDLRIQEREPRELSRNVEPEDLTVAAKRAAVQVLKAIAELTPKQQKDFAALQSNKDGTYSQEQLQFIKLNCPKEAYGAAREYNHAKQLLNIINLIGRQPERFVVPAPPADGSGRIPEGILHKIATQKDEFVVKLVKQVAKTAAEVAGGIAELPKKQQLQYAAMKPNEDGTLSPEQLMFVKKNCPKEIYTAAREYNQALETLNKTKETKELTQFDRMLMKKEAGQNSAVVGEAVAGLPLGLQKEYSRLQTQRDGSFSKEQLQFIKEHCPKEASVAALRFNELNHTLNMDSAMRFRDSKPELVKITTEKLIELHKQEMVKSATIVGMVLKGMTEEQRTEFANLASGKLSYSREQLQFLKLNSKEGYMAASSYNDAVNAITALRLREKLGGIAGGASVEIKPIKPPGLKK